MDICYPPGTDWSCRFTDEEFEKALEDDALARSIAISEAYAWSLLASLTAYQIGTCPVTIRPCAARCAPPGTWLVAPVSRSSLSGWSPVRIGMFNPYISGGVWYNACGCGTAADSCDCGSAPTVVLPGPVGRIESIKIDGVELDPLAYRVDNGNLLIRQDGEAWPMCQDMASAIPGFEVTYYRGAAPNVMTRRAAGVLANEFLLNCEGQDCRLPSNVTRATRGGESYEFSTMDFPDGDTGGTIPEVDALIRIYNPNRLKMPVMMASPETVGVGGRQTTWRRR